VERMHFNAKNIEERRKEVKNQVSPNNLLHKEDINSERKVMIIQ